MQNRYSQTELENAFNGVCNSDDWRAPIKATVAVEDLDLIKAAVAHFTATEARVTARGGRHAIIEAAGYRNGPAGP